MVEKGSIPGGFVRVESSLSAAWWWPTARFILLSLIFSLTYTQSPLYTSNQNQYFLHGLAAAGHGTLTADWLANTLDPTPLFSLLVRLTHPLSGLFYIYYALLMGVYLVGLLVILASIYDFRRTPLKFFTLLGLLLIVHSAALRFALSRSLGVNWAYLFEDGVADQRLLGPVFQPSAFGALLVLSIALYLRHRPVLAVLSAVLAASFHPTYLLSAAVLTLAYLVLTFSESLRDRRAADTGVQAKTITPIGRRPSFARPLCLGLTALLAVLPILAYVYLNFAGTPPETTAQARALLVHTRIPHHALVSWWLDATALVKIALVLAALVVIRRRPLFPILLIPSLVAAGLTLVQVLLASDALALLFPWRLSIFLVPISTAILIAHLVEVVFDRQPQMGRALAAASLGVALLALAVGVIRLKLDFERKAEGEDRPLMAYTAAHPSPGMVYLTPVKMQDFRLAAGAPVFVDFKSIPYRDSDVLEWRRRIQLADRFYAAPDCSQMERFRREEGVTAIVLEAKQLEFSCPGWEETYRDIHFAVLSSP